MSKAANLAVPTDEPLFSPYRLGMLGLANRMVMAPMTRSRALSDGVAYLTNALSELGISYLHVIDPIDNDTRATPTLRRLISHTYIVNSGFDAETANGAIRSGEADLVAFGISFLANPDLPRRDERRAALNTPDRPTFYTGEADGYIDYPSLRE